MRRRSPLRRARRRRFRARFRRRGSSRWTRSWRNGAASWPRRDGIHREIVPASSARRHRSGDGVVHRRLRAQQPAVPGGDLGDPRPAGLSRRSTAGSSISIRIRPRRRCRRASGRPGFFATLRGAMSDIPSSQPVTDELSWVLDFNDRVRRLRAIIDSARPQISQLVGQGRDHQRSTGRSQTTSCAAWREQVNVARRARRGLCLSGLCAAQARLGARLRRAADRQAARRAGAIAAMRAWWRKSSTPGRCARVSSTSAPTAKRSSSRPQTRRALPGMGEISSRLRRQIPRAAHCIF